MAPIPNKTGSSRRDDKDQDRRDRKRAAESPRRQTDRDGDRRLEAGRPEWGSKSTRRSVAGQSALVSRDGSQPKRVKHAVDASRNGDSSASGVRRSSRNTMPPPSMPPPSVPAPSSSRQNYDLGRGVTYALSASPPRAAGDSHRIRSSVVASGSQAPDAPPSSFGPEEMLDLTVTMDDRLESSDDENLNSFASEIESLNIPEAPANIESLLDAAAAGSSRGDAGKEHVAQQPKDDDHADQLSLAERARQRRGKDVVEVTEQSKASDSAIPSVEPAKTGKEKGALAVMEQMRKLKEKTTSFVSELISGGPRFVVGSVRPLEDGPVNSRSLVLPMGSWEEARSARVIRTDLEDLHDFLRKSPLDAIEATKMLKKLMGVWANMYPSPLPSDLQSLTTHMGLLARRLELGSTFEEVTLDQGEADAHSHLRRLEAACIEVAADLEVVEGGRTELVSNGRKATSMKEKQASKVAEYKRKVKEYEEKLKEYQQKLNEHEQKAATAHRREEELRRLEGLAAENIEAFDRDVKSQSDNIARLTKLRDEMKDHAARIAEEKKRLQAGTPADVADILSYSVKPPGGEEA